MKISKHARGNYYTTFKGKFIYGATPEEVDKVTRVMYVQTVKSSFTAMGLVLQSWPSL